MNNEVILLFPVCFYSFVNSKVDGKKNIAAYI